ncbi:hypothetical protein ACQKOE_13725 [Novosphingobium sp. NPDC080210]|uniref:hypothetical protein n=1 Tax=Novosphingobium sp. NPDC080210 TaxID=3390596 RepID=UPI003D025172
MTVTDEDRKAAIRFLESACRNWRNLGPLSNDDIADVAGALARYTKPMEQAAYAAGLERAAVIAEKMRDRCDPKMSQPEAIRYDEANVIATAIRAEKEKTNDL